MSDNQPAAPASAGTAESFVADDDERAWNYWIDQAQRLNTAKLRTFTEHFRRDALGRHGPAAIVNRPV